jgi:vancomycin permeability regulator SanA
VRHRRWLRLGAALALLVLLGTGAASLWVVVGVRRAVLVTQGFHLPRAVYTARRLGIDAVGVAADRQRYRGMAYYVLREQVSRLFGLLRVHLRWPPPRFLT